MSPVRKAVSPGIPFFQLPEPKEMLFGDLKPGQLFIWQGREFRKTATGRQCLDGGRPGKNLDECEIVTI